MLMLVKVYDYIRSFAAPRSGAARDHGQDVFDLERLLHIDVEHPFNRWLTNHDPLEAAAGYWYQYAHITVTMAVLVWCYVSAPGLYRRARNALVVTNLVGMTVFLLYPVMPPRLLPGAGFVDSNAVAGFQSAHYGSVEPDEFAAMPSLHLSWAVWTALLAMTLIWGRRWRPAFLIYPLITTTVVIATANHYLLDVFAGIAVALLATWATGQLLPGRPVPLAVAFRRPVQMIRRRSRKVNTAAPGSKGSQTVSSRYPTTAAMASGPGTPATAAKTAGSATSSAPTPPGEGTSAVKDETTT
jgi:hypothetical protein